MIILYLILILLVWYIWSHSKIKFSSRLWLIYGKKGSGKTTLLSKIAQTMIRKGHPVYSTDPIKGTIPISSNHYFKFRYPKGSVILIDEIGIVHDNREFKKFESQARDWYKLQRHMGVMVVACSQTADCDKKIQVLADKVSIVRSVTPLVSYVRFYERRITVARHSDGEGKQMKGSEIVDDVFPSFLIGGFLFTAGWRWWKFFDSYAVPDWPLVSGWDGETTYPLPRPKRSLRLLHRLSKSNSLEGDEYAEKEEEGL